MKISEEMKLLIDAIMSLKVEALFFAKNSSNESMRQAYVTMLNTYNDILALILKTIVTENKDADI